ncbi:MAG: radical SAM protein [Anaerolineae bacterium]|nr:radical SAM protein [Anaerolineae bacterium]
MVRQWRFRLLGVPSLPFSLVVSVTYRCNSRCHTCNVWRKQSEELELEEWQQVFGHLGHSPRYLTFSGGEPFLRRDLVEIVSSAYQSCRPLAITIPTNGLLGDRVVEACDRIAAACPESNVGINLSLDEVGERHDELRGVPGNWERATSTWQGLKRLRRPNLTLSIHTVISRYNVSRLPQIRQALLELEPDSYITEIAERRRELDTLDADFAPEPEEYRRAVAELLSAGGSVPARRFAALTQALRARYYRLAVRIVAEERQVIPCYAGWASGHIAPDGDVWTCCTRAEPIGNLRQTGYDLGPIWRGEEAASLRRSIRARECACPMANAAYTNMLLDPASLVQVVGYRLQGIGHRL